MPGPKPHPPIAIDGDFGSSGLLLGHSPVTGEPLYRPGAGIVAGRGTPDDPLVIAGWQVAGLRISGTTLPLVVSQVVVDAPGSLSFVALPPAVEVAGARNVTFDQVSVVASDRIGIVIHAAEHVRLDAVDVPWARYEALHVRDSAEVSFTRGSLTGYQGVVASGSRALRIEDSVVYAHGWFGQAAVVSDSRDVEVKGNHLTSAGLGADVRYERVSGGRVDGNHAPRGVEVRASADVEVRANDVMIRITSRDSARMVVEENRVLPGGTIVIERSPEAVVRRNVVSAPSDRPNPTRLADSPRAIVESNVFDNGLLVQASSREGLPAPIPPSNTVRGRPILHLDNATGVDLHDAAGPVVVTASEGVRVTGGLFDSVGPAVQILWSRNVSVEDVRMANVSHAVVAADSSGVTIERLAATVNVDRGVAFARVRDGRMTDSRLTGQLETLSVLDSPEAMLSRNEISIGRNGWSLSFARSPGATLANNTLAGSFTAMSFHDTAAPRILSNTFTGFRTNALFYEGADGAVLRGNNFRTAGSLVWNVGAETVDARGNWWGCASGPGSAPCAGFVGDVLATPWLAAENPDAGR